MYVSCTHMHINYTYNLSFHTSEEIVTQRQEEICLRAHRSFDSGNCTIIHYACVCAKMLQSCLTLCDPVDCSLPGSSRVGCHALLQGNLPDPGIKPVISCSSCLAGGFYTTEPLGKAFIHYTLLLI